MTTQSGVRKRVVLDASGDPRRLVHPLWLLLWAPKDQRLGPRKFFQLRAAFNRGIPRYSQDIAWSLYMLFGVGITHVGMVLWWKGFPVQFLLFVVLGLGFIVLAIDAWIGASPQLHDFNVIAAYLGVGRCPSCGQPITMSEAAPDRPSITCSECGSEWRHPGAPRQDQPPRE